MKRHTFLSAAISALAVISLSGCASQDAVEQSTLSIAEVTEIAAESDAFVTYEQERLTEPPLLAVEYSGDGLSSAAKMTLGTYSWDNNGEMTEACSAGPLEAESSGLINAVVDLDLVSEGEPKIGLAYGAKIISVKLCPLDGSDEHDVSFTEDGALSFSEDDMDGVAVVTAEYELGQAEYYFTITRSQTSLDAPPKLRVYSGDIGFEMTQNGFTWTTTSGVITTDCPTPWQAYEGGSVTPELSSEPGGTFSVLLPESSAITSAVYYTAEDEKHELSVNGGTLTMPDEVLSAVCCITVEMPQGTCDYLFSVKTGDSSASAGQTAEG